METRTKKAATDMDMGTNTDMDMDTGMDMGTDMDTDTDVMLRLAREGLVEVEMAMEVLGHCTWVGLGPAPRFRRS